MNVKKWFAIRGPKFVVERASKLVGRYGISAQQSTRRIEDCMQTLASFGCAPTFFTPGIVVERYPRFIQGLQSQGAEIAVHSYQHVDLRTLKLAEAINQLEKAIQVFEINGIAYHGFRCPYLSCSDELLDALPTGMFNYSSNRTLTVDVPALDWAEDQNTIFGTLRRFYQPMPFLEVISTPWVRPNLFEIPMYVPDDLQLHDGLQLGPEGIGQVWDQVLEQVYQRGELFTLIFHPELASVCKDSFVWLLQKAQQFRPAVWITRLRDVSDWWQEKTNFKVEVTEVPTGLRLTFTCSPRATLLARGLGQCESGQVWDGAYDRLQSRVLDVSADPRPFVGVAPHAPESIVPFLQQQGYIVDTADTATRCGIYLDAARLASMTNVQLVDFIEASPSPLVRYWRWPDGAKCALCVTGDLDALTLVDYATRLFIT